jgi:geranylgeranyl pyrophosphate synthase
VAEVESSVMRTYGDFVSSVFARLRVLVRDNCSRELSEPLEYQLSTMERSKGVRPALVAAAARMTAGHLSNLLDRGAGIQAIHEFTLIIDDILDDSPMRRGKQSLRTAYDPIIAGCVAAELDALAEQIFDDDPEMRRQIRWFKREVSVAETIQIQESFGTRPFPLNRWQRIALGDTGSLFELALSAGGLFARGSRQLEAMAYLRHGLDDIDDVLDEDGDQADVRDGIPTLLTVFTAGESLGELLSVIGHALEWLRPFLSEYRVQGAEPRWELSLKPFFDDFAVAWKKLRAQSANVPGMPMSLANKAIAE